MFEIFKRTHLPIFTCLCVHIFHNIEMLLLIIEPKTYIKGR